jgi:hypothetical protein
VSLVTGNSDETDWALSHPDGPVQKTFLDSHAPFQIEMKSGLGSAARRSLILPVEADC